MSSLRIVLCMCLSLFVSAGVPALAVKPDKAKTIKVNCAIGERINEALETNAKELVIAIDGICVEDVVIRRMKTQEVE